MKNPEGSTLLTTTDLTVGYYATLLERLNLELRAGELVCFMGPNGIGKSTLIRTLAGLQLPRAGKVNIHTLDAADPFQKIAVVLTDKIGASHLTAYELITFGRYPYLGWNVRLTAHDKDVIESSIDLVHVRHLLNMKLHELSDGQLQLVMIARALAQETPIILLDEPTAHLDLNNRIEIMRLLRNVAHQTKRAILVATHELDLALQTTDWIWLTGKNKNIITGTPEDLVLNGSFDEVFEFKGFDLKSGKVQHELYRGKTISLIGEGSSYLWTKNALERNGYRVDTINADHEVSIESEGTPRWVMDGKPINSIFELLSILHNR